LFCPICCKAVSLRCGKGETISASCARFNYKVVVEETLARSLNLFLKKKIDLIKIQRVHRYSFTKCINLNKLITVYKKKRVTVFLKISFILHPLPFLGILFCKNKTDSERFELMEMLNAYVYPNEGLHDGRVNVPSILDHMTIFCIPSRVHM